MFTTLKKLTTFSVALATAGVLFTSCGETNKATPDASMTAEAFNGIVTPFIAHGENAAEATEKFNVGLRENEGQYSVVVASIGKEDKDGKAQVTVLGTEAIKKLEDFKVTVDGKAAETKGSTFEHTKDVKAYEMVINNLSQTEEEQKVVVSFNGFEFSAVVEAKQAE